MFCFGFFFKSLKYLIMQFNVFLFAGLRFAEADISVVSVVGDSCSVS